MRFCKPASFALALAVVSAVPVMAPAAVRDWSEPAGSVASNGAAWRPVGAPGPKDIARFNLSSAYTVTFASNATNLGLQVGNDKLVFDLGRGTYVVPAKRNAIYLGLKRGDVSRVTFRNGTIRSGPTIVGGVAGSSGNITVSGGSTWANSGLLAVGGYGVGGLTITGGGKLSSDTGGVGMYARSKGNVIVSSSGSTWNVAKALAVGGKAGTGQVIVRNGATLSVGEKLDISKGSTVRLEGGHLKVGNVTRSGTMTFQSGQFDLTKSDLDIGSGGLFGRNLSLGPKQSLNVAKSATVKADGVLGVSGGGYSAAKTTNFGKLDVAGQLRGALTNSAGGAVRVTGSTATFAGDVVHNGQEFWVGPSGKALFQSDVRGNGGFTGTGEITFAGTYSPGNSTGMASFDNQVRFASSGRLRLEIGGTTPGASFDQLRLARVMQLRQVEVVLMNGFQPKAGDRFALIDGPVSFADDFSISLPAVGSGRVIQFLRDGQGLSLAVVAATPVIPEPATGLLLGAVGLGLAWRRPRRR